MSALRRNTTIAACVALSAVLGTIHAFSVFIPQWENLPGADRASVSLIYSLALASLTVAVLFGYRLYRRVSPATIFCFLGVVAALGLMLSAYGSSLITLYLTYGLIFGGANGLGYGYTLQLAGQAAPEKRGFAMGLVTAFYAVGATLAPPIFVFLIEHGGNALALQIMAGIVFIVTLMAAVFLKLANARYESEPDVEHRALAPTLYKARILLWVGYGSAVIAGLMLIGHAYSIAVWTGLSASSAAWATMIVAFGNMLGGFSAGYFADKFSSSLLLRWLPLLTSLSLILLVLPSSKLMIAVFIALSLAGYSYGAIIAIYPVAIVDVFGALAAPKIYGQVFTAWGLAGLIAPWVSGWLYDATGTYKAALTVAALFSLLSFFAMSINLRRSQIRS